MQIDMLAKAAATNMQYIVEIYKQAVVHCDYDTQDYIYTHYFAQLNDAQLIELRDFCVANMPAELLAEYTIYKAMQH